MRIKASINANNKVYLEWDGDTTAGGTYEVARNVNGAWNVLQTSTAKTFEHTASIPGYNYEYQIIRLGSISPRVEEAHGYISVGFDTPAVHERGRIILLVDTVPFQDATYGNTLRTKVDRLVDDLITDGYFVIRHDLDRTMVTVPQVRALITAAYNGNPVEQEKRVKTVFILGHISVPYSGNMAPDGHVNHMGAWPADVYYGDIDDGNTTGSDEWTDTQNHTTTQDPAFATKQSNVASDGKFDQNYLPSDVELQVGRVDFFDLGGAFTSKNECQLLIQYLDKDHNYRRKSISLPPRRGLIGDARPNDWDPAIWGPPASAWRRMVGAFGSSSLWSYAGRVEEHVVNSTWWTKVTTDSYLESAVYSTSGIGPNYVDNLGYSSQFATKDIKLTFATFLASYIGDWNTTDNFLRASLGTTTYTLATYWDGLPHWFTHHMASGEPIGFSARLTQNQSGTFYKSRDVGTTLLNNNGTSWETVSRSTHTALLGDPTLRLHVVQPVSGLGATVVGNTRVDLSWTAPSGEVGVQGYHVYRAWSKYGPFKRLTATPVTGTTYSDLNVPRGFHTYMVRTLKLEGATMENMGSGRYYNLSQGVTVPIDLPNGVLWTLTELNVSGSSSSGAVAVNNNTHIPFTVVGDYDDLSYISRATKWQNGTPTIYNGYWSSLDASFATAVNDAETVVGYVNKYDSVLGYGHTIRPFVWPWIGGVSLLDTLPSGGNTEASAISGGSIVGFGKNSSGYSRAIRWSGTAAQDLGTLAGLVNTYQSFAYGVNNAGFIVGKTKYTTANNRNHAFLFQPSDLEPHLQNLVNSAVDLGVLGIGDNSEAYAINNHNEVVGASQTSGTSSWRGFIRKPGQALTQINPPSGTAHTYAYGINDSGVVVGVYGSSPLIWQERVGSRDLNSYRSNPYFTIYVAEAINNQNVVVGYGYGSSGYRAFVLSPP